MQLVNGYELNDCSNFLWMTEGLKVVGGGVMATHGDHFVWAIAAIIMTDCLRLPISFLPLLPKFFSVLLHSSDSDRNPNPGTWVSEAAVSTLPQGRNNFSPLPKLNNDHEPRSSRRLNHNGGKPECRDGNIDVLSSVFFRDSPPSRTNLVIPMSVGSCLSQKSLLGYKSG
jgi:hypothetical protein